MKLDFRPIFAPQRVEDANGVSQYAGEGTDSSPYIVKFGDKDIGNPKAWSTTYRWFVNIIAALTMMTGTFAISSYASGLGQMAKVSVELAKVGQTLYLIGLAIGTMLFPATADYFGRRTVILFTMAVFSAFSIGVALGRNITTVLICRLLTGFFASAAQTLLPAQLSSLFTPKELAVPFTTAAIAPFLGPSLGPLLGGYVVQYSKSWRNINWVAMGLASLFTLLYALFVPETFEPYILRRRARALQQGTGKLHVAVFDLNGRKTMREELRVFIVRPMQYLVLEPIVTIFTFYAAFLYGILNLFFESYPFIYITLRDWSEGSAGLPFIALLVGFFLSVPVTFLFGRPYIKALQRDGKPTPELRLMYSMLSAVLLPISMFWIGWTAEPRVSWVAPVFAGGMFGFSQIGLQMSTLTYLADVYGPTVGAAFAALNFVRFLLSSVFPLFAEQMYANLGAGWASSVLGFLLVLFMPAPFLFYRFGPKIRSWSPTLKK